MSAPRLTQPFVKQSVWLGIAVGWLAQLGLRTILPVLVLSAGRLLTLGLDDKSLWPEEPIESSHPVWYVLQATIFIGSAFAGWLAALLSPPRSILVPVSLILLSLLATAFEQLPMPMSPTIVAVWAVGPCAGLLLGWLLVRLAARGDA